MNDSNPKQIQPIPDKDYNAKTSESQKDKEVHNQVHILGKYPELETIITAWPKLPEQTKQAINSLIESVKIKK